MRYRESPVIPLEPQAFLNPAKSGEFIICRARDGGEIIFRVKGWSNLRDGVASARGRGYKPQFVCRVKLREPATA